MMSYLFRSKVLQDCYSKVVRVSVGHARGVGVGIWGSFFDQCWGSYETMRAAFHRYPEALAEEQVAFTRSDFSIERRERAGA
jgi:hypothetical protein